MKLQHRYLPSIGAALLLALHGAPALAQQSLRCHGQLLGAGESKSAVAQKCGGPMAVQSVCVPTVSQPQNIYFTAPDGTLRQAWSTSPQCAPAEDWIYSRGPGSFMAIVRIKDGVVESVRDGDRAP